MTAIDTSKLKEGMREFLESVVFYNMMQSYRIAPMLDQERAIRRYEDVKEAILSCIDKAAQSDLQEQDRVEAWEPKPGELVRGKKLRESLDQAEIIWVDGKLIHKQKGINDVFYLIQDGLGSFHLCVAVKPIPKDPDGELRQIIRSDRDQYVRHGISTDDTIQQIKSLLAAKVPSRETFNKFIMDYYNRTDSDGLSLDGAWNAFLHFTKNETK